MVEVVLDEVVLSGLEVEEAGSSLEVVEGAVVSGVDDGSADEVGSAGLEEEEEEEVVEVVGTGSGVVVVGGTSEDSEEEVDEDVDVVSGGSEEEVSDVISGRILVTAALWAATAVNSRAWMKNERLDRRMAE